MGRMTWADLKGRPRRPGRPTIRKLFASSGSNPQPEGSSAASACAGVIAPDTGRDLPPHPRAGRPPTETPALHGKSHQRRFQGFRREVKDPCFGGVGGARRRDCRQ